jgi:hypothetical protein
MMLSHRKIGVASEDDVITILMQWFKLNIQYLREDHILQLVFNVNWPYVSFDKLLTIFKSFPQLRQIQQSKSIFYKEIQKRVTKSK